MAILKRILPVIALATALVVMAGGLAFAGPNAAAKIVAALDKTTGVKAGDAVVLTVSITGGAGVTGYTAEAIYDTVSVGEPATAAKLAGAISPGKTTDSIITPAIAGYNRRTSTGGAQLPSNPVTGSTDIAAFTFTAKAGFTTTKIGVRQLILRAGTAIDTLYPSPSPLALQINPPPPPAPAIALSDTTLKFDSTRVGATSTKTFTITNAGGSVLVVTGITGTGADSLQFTPSPKTDSIAVGKNRVVTVTFAPLSTTSAGAKTATLWIAHNATGTPSKVVLSGVAYKQVAVDRPKVESTVSKTETLTATFTKAPTDSITWTLTGTIAGTTVTIVAINGDTAAAQKLTTRTLGTTGLVIKAAPAVAGSSTITLKVTNPAAATGPLSVTAVASSGGTSATSTLTFSVPVPAELSAFTGMFADGKVQLNWTTVSQTNNAGWRILRSVDNATFEPVSGLVSGAGTSNDRLDYQFADVNLPKEADRLFYMLEQVDLDGKVTRSRVAEVLLGGRFVDTPKEFSTAVFPNPFNPSTTVAYHLPESATVSIVIYDAIGQSVRTLVGNAATSAGRYSVQWDARDDAGRPVASGVYFAQITAGKFSGQQKMMLLK